MGRRDRRTVRWPLGLALEAYNRILEAVAAEGIRVGSRQVMVVAPPGAPPAAGISGAAAAAGGAGPSPSD
jgi:hypothetical protein